MRAVTVRRSQADIADDIVFELRPLRRLKRDEVRPEPAIAISQHIETINKIVAAWARIGAVDVIRKRGARAVRALAALEKVCPILDVRLARERIWLLMYTTKLALGKKGREPRANNHLHWLCTHQAITLIEQFSKRPPVTTAGGNAHLIGSCFSRPSPESRVRIPAC